LPSRGNLHDRKSERSRGEPYSISEAEVIREFAKLDLVGEGRLTFLTVKSALELMRASGTSSNDDMDDVVVRGWLRDHDQGAKGYVDMADFRRIFANVISDGNDENYHALNAGNGTGRINHDFTSTRDRDDRINRLKT
jgi:hypothetical protein